jgi:hypothetical protein
MAPPAAKIRFGRRELFRGAAALGVAACSAAPRSGTPVARLSPPRLEGAASLWSWFDLPPEDARSRELSGIAWDAPARTLWAVQDESPRIVALRPDDDLRTWRFGETVDVNVAGPLDLEGIAVVPDGFVVCSEDGPRILELDRRGGVRHELAVPPRFYGARANKSLESLAMSPSGQYLFTTSEAALPRDGSTATRAEGTRVRIARLDRPGGEVSEHVYVTDPTLRDGGDYGVSELAALGDDELLVLERGWLEGAGNTVRIYRASLSDRASCLGVSTLPAGAPALEKTLVADLSTLAASGVPPAKQPQANPILDNYEGLAVGPRLRDGRSTLILVSDDNGRSDQVARILVLAFG